MKKCSLKKIVTLLLVVVMLMSALPVQSFAALSLGNPKITGVAFQDDTPVSMKEIEMLHTLYGKEKISLSSAHYSEDPGSGFYYDNILVSFSNGKTVELDKLFDEIPNTVSYSGPQFTVSYTDCKNAIANGEDTVPVNVELIIYFEKGKPSQFDGDIDVKIVESVVESIKPVGELPPFYEGMNYYDYFVGQEIEIEYADGTKKTATIAEGEYKGSIGPLELDGKPLVTHTYDITVDYDEEGNEIIIKLVRLALGDAVYEGHCILVESPYKAIDIVDYKIEKGNILKNITYKITKQNGEEEIRTKDCNITDFTDAVIIDKLGVYRVEVDVNVDIASIQQNSIGSIAIYLGDGYSDYEDGYKFNDYARFDASDYCSCICHKKGISKLIYSMLIKIWDLFGINEQCKCGAWHWDE